MKFRRSIPFLAAAMIAAGALSAYAETPIESLKNPMNEVIDILKNPKYQSSDERAAQRKKIWKTVHGMFDFTEIAKRALARNWREFSPQQQTEFTDLFAELLGATYMDKIQGNYQNESVNYVNQQMLPNDRAAVETEIVQQNGSNIGVNYLMKKEGNSWKIYDVKVQGVSLVLNYRTQFNQILMNESPAQLIQKLKKKVDKEGGESLKM